MVELQNYIAFLTLVLLIPWQIHNYIYTNANTDTNTQIQKDRNDKRRQGGGGMPAAVIAGNTIAAEPVPALCTHIHILLH